jgi:hypothetical protein
MVMNVEARDLVLGQRNDAGIIYEDWWFYLVISAFGTVLYDSHMKIDYRRHGQNAIGSPMGWRRVVAGWHILRRGELGSLMRGQALALEREFGPRLPADAAAALREFLDRPRSLLGRMRHALTCGFYRQRAIDGAVVRLLFVTAKNQP